MKMNKKIKIIGIVVTLSLCIGACNLQKEVCDSKNCKNEVYKNGLCPDHYVKEKLAEKDDKKSDTEDPESIKNNKEILAVLEQYYDAYTDCDINKLQEVAHLISPKEISFIKILSKYYDEIDDIEICFEKKVADDQYMISVRNSVQFKNVSIKAPAVDFFYLVTDKDGNWYIDNTCSFFNYNYKEYEIDSEKYDQISQYMNEDEFTELQQEVDEEYKKVKDNTQYKKEYNKLCDDIAKWNEQN